MVSSFAILLGLSATFANCDAANQTTTIEDEGLACNDMASALAKLQTLTGTQHIAVTPDPQTKAIHSL